MILKQRLGKTSYNGTRLYIEDSTLDKLNLGPGTNYKTEVNISNNLVTIKPSNSGNVVSSKTKKYKRTGEHKIVPVIDKSGAEIKSALSDCSYIKITFIKDEHDDDRVLIQGFKDTASVIRDSVHDSKKRNLTTIEFCAGVGISAEACRAAGFKSIAFCEWNPKVGSEDRYANIFKENHPDSVMFNIPMEKLNSNDLPYADVWFATLDCTDFTKLAPKEKEYQTMHLFIHLMRLFYERTKTLRPLAVVIENVEGFEKVAGNSLKLCYEDEGYFVTMEKIDSLEYGSRTKRERFYFVATCYEGFSFPDSTGKINTPISDDGVITVDTLEWLTPETSGTLKHFVERNDHITHGHKIISYDITKDTHVGTITKSHYKLVPENLIKHPYKQNTYAFLKDANQLKYIHGIPNNYYLGDSNTLAVQGIGQGVDFNTFFAIAKKLYDFLTVKLFKSNNTIKQPFGLVGDQFCFI